jgi:hypothetical protein
VEAAVLLWLIVYVFSPAFFFQYVVWGLPFFLMAGYLKQVALLQLTLLPPTLIFYMSPWEDGAIARVYVPIMAAVWLASVAALLFQARKIAGSEPAPTYALPSA